MQSFWAPTFFATTKAGPQQRRFERDSVRRVLRTFGLSEHEAGMVAEYKKLWGEAWLTFEGFFRQFQTFPIILEAHSFFKTTAKESFMTLSSWLTRFENTFIWDRYCVLFNRYRAICEGEGFCDPLPPWLHGLPVGMVFNYDGFPGGLIVHNGEPLTKRLCLRFDCKIKLLPKGPTEPIRCWIEPFCDWLAALAERGWSPEGSVNPLEVEPAPPLPEREKANPLLPWAVRALGAGPDSVLLSWLYHVLRADSNTHPKAAVFCTYWKGRKCVAASQADIGFVLRLSEKQVKSAVARLRKEGFVRTERGRNKFGVKTMFTLNEDQCLGAQSADRESECLETWPVEWVPLINLKTERTSRLMPKPQKSTFWSSRGY